MAEASKRHRWRAPRARPNARDGSTRAERFGLCILGCGRFAGFHARAARALGPGIALSFASRDPARAESFRRRFGGEVAFGSYEAAAADPRVDGLVVCTPHSLHRDHVRLGARYRKALLEKPIAPTVGEADAILELVHSGGTPFMVAENFHFVPAFVEARRLLAAGAIGRVRQVLVNARGFREPGGWRRRRTDAGGGLLIDGGVHYVHLLRDWGGPIAEVTAVAPPNLFADLDGEDTAFLLMRHRSGAVSLFANSLAAPGLPRSQSAWVTGTEGSLGVDNRGRWLWLRGARRSRFRVYLRDQRGLRAQLAEFVEAVRAGRPPALDARSARDDVAVVAAAYASMESGLPVRLPEEG
jgi:predicted dehydrogenase